MVSLQNVHSSSAANSGVSKPKLKVSKNRPEPEISVRRDDPDLLTRTSWTNAAVALSQIKKVIKKIYFGRTICSQNNF